MSDARDSWQLVGGVAPSEDLNSAKIKAKALDLGTNKRWAADRSSPGNGVTRAGFVCNNHLHCGFKLLVKRAGGAFNVYWKGTHSEEGSMGQRSNSALTWEQAAFGRTSLKTGSKPAELLGALTDDALEAAEAAGTEAEKREEGGLKGEPRAPRSRGIYDRAVYRKVYSVCIQMARAP